MTLNKDQFIELLKNGKITLTGFVAKNENGEITLAEGVEEKLSDPAFVSGLITQTGIVPAIERGEYFETSEGDVVDPDSPDEGEPKVKPTIKNELLGDLVEGTEVDSRVSIVPGDYAGTMVRVKGTVNPVDAIATLYKEGEQWLELPVTGDEFYFGPASGFPISDAVSEFKTSLKKAGDVTIKLELIAVENSEVLATSDETVTIKPKAEEPVETVAAPLNAVGLGNPVAPAPAEDAPVETTAKKTRKKSTTVEVAPAE